MSVMLPPIGNQMMSHDMSRQLSRDGQCTQDVDSAIQYTNKEDTVYRIRDVISSDSAREI